LTARNATCKDLLSCLYDLSSTDTRLLALLLREGKPKTLDELAGSMERDRGTVFRSLQRLVSLGFCTKQTVNLKEGGYKHLYNTVGVEKIEENAEQRIKEIQSSLKRLMGKFHQDIREMAAGGSEYATGKTSHDQGIF
jgi:predicted transcriptional regulator